MLGLESFDYAPHDEEQPFLLPIIHHKESRGGSESSDATVGGGVKAHDTPALAQGV